MKYLGYLMALAGVIFLTIQKHHHYPDSALMKAIIFDERGEEVWTTESYGHKCIEIKQGIPQITLGNEVPLFESYLKEVRAEKLSIWLDYGDGYEHYVDYELSDLSLKEEIVQNKKEDNHEKKSTKRKHVKVTSKMDRPENPLERQQWRLMQKGGEIDFEKRRTARKVIKENIEKIKKENKTYLRDAGVANWTSMGPNNIGGRVRAIAAHPINTDIIYIGAAGGGIWKSTNGGSSWTNLDDFMASLVVTSIVIDHKKPNVIYASTGEGQGYFGLPGAGVFMSSDDGTTWNQLESTSAYKWINKLEMDPIDSKIIYAAITLRGSNSFSNSNGNILRTTDGGDTWNLLLTSGSSNAIMDIEISEDEPDLILATGYDAYWRSDNGGFSFVNQLGAGSNPLPAGVRRIEVDVFPSDVNIVYALVHKDSTSASTSNNETYRCLLYHSIDAGINWSLTFSDIDNVFPSNGFGDYSNSIWVNPSNSKLVYFGGINLWGSEANGVSAKEISDWTHYHRQTVPDSFSLHGDQHIIVPHPNFDGITNSTVYFGNDGGIQKADDINSVSEYNGWSNLANQSLGITQFYSGAVSPDGTLFGGGAQDNSFCTGTNSTNWKQCVTGDGAYMAINPDHSDTVFANTNYNKLWISTDGGSSFSNLISGIPISLRDLGDDPKLISPFIMDGDRPQLLFMGGEQLWKVDMNNLPPVSIKNAIPSAHISSIASTNNAQTIWVGYTNGILQKSVDGGNSWSPNMNPAGNFYNSLFITDIDFSTDGSQVIISIAGYHDTPNTNLWKYDVVSDNWTNISMDLPIPVNCVSHHPFLDDWIYIGTDLGIFASEDNGTAWSTTPLYEPIGSEYGNEGPIYTEVTDLFWNRHPKPNFNGIFSKPSLWATTFGRGLWKSNWIIGKYYVDRINGNDIWPGSSTLPFKTLRKASEVAGSGATIHFVQGNDNNQGTHEETQTIVLDKRVLIELNNGPVIIQ